VGRKHEAPPLIGFVWTDDGEVRLDGEQGAAIVRALWRIGPAYAWEAGAPRAMQPQVDAFVERLIAEGRWTEERQKRTESARKERTTFAAGTPLGAVCNKHVGQLRYPDGSKTWWGTVKLEVDDICAAVAWLSAGQRFLTTDRAQRWPHCAERIITDLELRDKKIIDVTARLIGDGELLLRFARPEVFASNRGNAGFSSFVRDAAVVLGPPAEVQQFTEELAGTTPATRSTPSALGHIVAIL
jgi:hypothetical protein